MRHPSLRPQGRGSLRKALKASAASAGTLRLILGDQLNAAHSWFKRPDDRVTYVIMEIRQETDYVKHHIQKVTAFFAVMRAFADHHIAAGHRVIILSRTA
jgi:deoxyribodipyrimidine photolyase-related protein